MQSTPFEYLINKADSIIIREELIELHPTIYQYKSLYYSSIGNTDSSIYYQLKAINIYEATDSLEPKLMNAYFNLCELYIMANLLDEALTYARKAIKQAKLEGDSLDLKYSYVQMGRINSTMANGFKNSSKNYTFRNKAIKEYKKALTGSKISPDSETFVFSALFGLSDNYREIYNLKLNDAHAHYLDSAEKYTNIAFSINSDSLDFNKNIARAQKSFILQERGQFKEALKLLNVVGKIVKMHNEPTNVKQFFKAKADLYKDMGIMDSAFHYQKLYYDISDSLVGLETRKYTSQLETQYKTAKKEKRIQALETQSKLQKARNQLSLTMAIAVGFILVIVSYFLVLNRRKSKKLTEQNKIIQQSHKEIEDLIRESHHRIKNNLQVVSSLLKMQSKNAKTDETRANLLEAFNRVKTIAVLHQKLQGSQTFKQIQMQDFVLQLIEAIQTSIMASNQNIELITDVDDIQLSTDQSISVGLIINEVVTNSFKYAFPEDTGVITLKLKKEGSDQICLQICDNGKGLPENFDISKNQSLGYKIVNSMAIKLKGELSILGTSGTCTTVEFTKNPIN